MKNIDYRFKLLYAIAVVMVLSFHFQFPFPLMEWFPLGGLHLALFAFGSGYFYKPKCENDLVVYIFKKFKHLIVPLYLTNFAYAGVVWVSRRYGFTIGSDVNFQTLFIDPIVLGPNFGYNLGAWFIPPLFFVEVLNAAFRKAVHLKLPHVPEWVFFVLALGAGIFGNSLAIYFQNELGRVPYKFIMLIWTLHFLPYYVLGIFYRSDLYKIEEKIPSIPLFLVLFGIKMLICMHYREMPEYAVSMLDDFDHGPVMPFIVAFVGIAFWFRVVTILTPAIGKSKLVNLIADHSLSITINQFLAYLICKYCFGKICQGISGVEQFDWGVYKHDIFYIYEPFEYVTLYLYGAFAIAFSLAISYCILYVKKSITRIPGAPALHL